MSLFSRHSGSKSPVALCAALALAAFTAGSALAADAPWYKRLLRRNKTEQSVAAPAIKTPMKSAAAPLAASPAAKPAPAPVGAYKEDSSALEVDDSLPEFAESEETLAEEAKIDLSEEMTPADEHLKREFPMPQPATPKAPYVAPTPDRYRPAPAAPRHVRQTGEIDR